MEDDLVIIGNKETKDYVFRITMLLQDKNSLTIQAMTPKYYQKFNEI